MKKIFLSIVCLGIFCIINHSAFAQNDEQKESNNEEIVIRKKGNKDSKITLEMKGDDVTINGKPLSEYNDDGITVIKRRNLRNDRNSMLLDDGGRGEDMQIFDDNDDNENPKAFLGVTTEKNDKGVRITSVSKGSSAERAGLKEGDVITKVGDKKVDGPDDLIDAVASQKPKDEVKIYYQRNGKLTDTKATLGEKKNTANYFSFRNNMPSMKGPMMKDFKFDMPFNYNGMQPFDKFWINPNKKIGVRIEDTENEAGVKVTNVEDGSAADKAGLKKDDIITEVNGEKVKNVGDVREEISQTDKDNFTVKAKRGSNEMSFEIKISKKMNSADL